MRIIDSIWCAISDLCHLENAIPQGSVLSPISLTTMINDLLSNIGSKVGLYADDSAIWESAININELAADI